MVRWPFLTLSLSNRITWPTRRVDIVFRSEARKKKTDKKNNNINFELNKKKTRWSAFFSQNALGYNNPITFLHVRLHWMLFSRFSDHVTHIDWLWWECGLANNSERRVCPFPFWIFTKLCSGSMLRLKSSSWARRRHEKLFLSSFSRSFDLTGKKIKIQ